MKKYLILENGAVFEGEAFGDITAHAFGELVFSTVMCGFTELLTSSKTNGQILLQTFPSVGNCGITDSEMEMKCYPSGYIVHEWCDVPSAVNAQNTVDAFLKKNLVPGISGIDCRALTRIIRENGSQRAFICDSVPEDIKALFAADPAVSSMLVRKEKTVFSPDSVPVCRILLADPGHSQNIVSELLKRGCEVISVSASAPDTAKDLAFDGIVIGDGPGDPAEYTSVIDFIRAYKGKLPMLGVGLGHCILAISNGAETEKLPFGHRGGQPVYDSVSGRTLVTGQYHGYAVTKESIKNGTVRYINSNDSTPEGIDYGKDGISTEFFHAEAFDIFMNLTIR